MSYAHKFYSTVQQILPELTALREPGNAHLALYDARHVGEMSLIGDRGGWFELAIVSLLMTLPDDDRPDDLVARLSSIMPPSPMLCISRRDGFAIDPNYAHYFADRTKMTRGQKAFIAGMILSVVLTIGFALIGVVVACNWLFGP